MKCSSINFSLLASNCFIDKIMTTRAKYIYIESEWERERSGGNEIERPRGEEGKFRLGIVQKCSNGIKEHGNSFNLCTKITRHSSFKFNRYAIHHWNECENLKFGTSNAAFFNAFKYREMVLEIFFDSKQKFRLSCGEQESESCVCTSSMFFFLFLFSFSLSHSLSPARVLSSVYLLSFFLYSSKSVLLSAWRLARFN